MSGAIGFEATAMRTGIEATPEEQFNAGQRQEEA
jgi:hypothetical protein